MALDRLVTEARRADANDDSRSTAELVELMSEADAAVPAAVAAVTDEVAAAIDAIVERLERGGRLIYVGAGPARPPAQAGGREGGGAVAPPPRPGRGARARAGV